MALPSIKINYKNGAIGGTEPMDDGVTLTFLSFTPALPRDIDSLTYEDFANQLGKDNELIKAFYNEVNGKARLIVSGKSIAAANAETNVKTLLGRFNGDVRNVVVPDVPDAAYLRILQNIGDWAATELFAPVVFIVSLAETYAKTNPKVSELGLNRVMVVDNVTDKPENGVPLLWYVAGRAAKSPVQRSLARVKDGAISAPEFWYVDGNYDRLVNNTYAEGKQIKGIVTARVFQGKAGYYFSDDLMATSANDDYGLLPRRRVIDKAYRIAYKTLVEYVGEEIPVLNDGTLPYTVCKDIQSTVKRAIYSNMTVNGNLGVDPQDDTDLGVECYVDPDQNILATNKIELSLKVKPYGYATYIECNLGFLVG
ncbi:MAG: DUF2586 family protein [Bacteroidales bacterium]|nr:DUF2586 family protein [Bacteroidales bacterium]